MVRIIGKENSIFNQFLMELRDNRIQTNRDRFRKNLRRIGNIFAYEISKTLEYKDVEVITPLGALVMKVADQLPVLVTILRAGLPLHEGLLHFFDGADSGFASAYRKYHKAEDFTIRLDYLSVPPIDQRVVIVSDPMIATGGSLAATLRGILETGTPSHLHIVSVVAGEEGITRIKKEFGVKNMTIWTGAVDAELTAQAYIVPGIGDAGDLAFGGKSD